ncbi:MAG: hypothetical protein QOK29_4038, partial [Rhodospirillaceae bacterium]|nr:hypothetical protein [Rhodospirillaceae bacterium]
LEHEWGVRSNEPALAHKMLGRHELDNLLLGRSVIRVSHGDLFQRGYLSAETII